MMTLDPQDIRRMKNHAAAVAQIDQATVAEFVALAQKTPREKQVKIADTLVGLVLRGEPMNHKGQPMTLATMAAIVVALA
jgi:hypothetical protein